MNLNTNPKNNVNYQSSSRYTIKKNDKLNQSNSSDSLAEYIKTPHIISTNPESNILDNQTNGISKNKHYYNEYNENKENINPNLLRLTEVGNEPNICDNEINNNYIYNILPQRDSIMQLEINQNLNLNNNINCESNSNSFPIILNNKNQIYINSPNLEKFKPILKRFENQIPLEYISDIWNNLRTAELEEPCLPKYENIKKQIDINENSRALLIDWIIEVHYKFKLRRETLFFCVLIIDRFLSKQNISINKFQLLGITALFIASKLEEILCPEIFQFVIITDNTFSKEEILSMENEILKLLNFDLTYPTSLSFFEILTLQYNFSEIEFEYGCYLIEYFLINPFYNKYIPSIISLAVTYLILKKKNYEEYRDLFNLVGSEYSEKDVKICAKQIHVFIRNFNKINLNSVFKKYSDKEFNSVAINGLNVEF